MDQNRKEELLTRWLDDALSDGDRREFEPYLAAHPELELERADYRRLRSELQAVVPAVVEPPYPDFFNSHLARQIREGESHPAESGPSRRSPLWSWLQPWLVPAAAAAVVVAFIAGQRLGIPEVAPVAQLPGAVAPAVYSSLATVAVETWENPEAGVTVIVLDGLDEIPSSVDLMETTAALHGDEHPGKVF